MNNKLLRKIDVYIIIIIVVISGSVLLFRSFSKSDNLTAIISINGETVKTINLSSITEKTYFDVETNPAVKICAENGSIWFEEADCPDKICVSTGKLCRKGETAICVPAKTVISISGSELDAVTW